MKTQNDFRYLSFKFIASIISSLIFISACDTVDQRLRLYNAGNDPIIYVWTMDEEFKEISAHQIRNIKKVIDKNNGRLVVRSNAILNPGEKEALVVNEWKIDMRDSKNKRLDIYFFKPQTLISNSWEAICENQIFDKKMSFTYEDFIKAKWLIVYDDQIKE